MKENSKVLMKAYRKEDKSPIHLLPRHWMEVSDQVHAPAVLPLFSIG
jgi:hypothetical protein